MMVPSQVSRSTIAGQDGGVADLLWDDVSSLFQPDLMGSLPDVRVPNASVEDWQAVLDLVAEKGWKCHYSEGETRLPVPRAEAVLSRPAGAECPDLWVWPTAEVPGRVGEKNCSVTSVST